MTTNFASDKPQDKQTIQDEYDPMTRRTIDEMQKIAGAVSISELAISCLVNAKIRAKRYDNARDLIERYAKKHGRSALLNELRAKLTTLGV